MSGGLKKWVRRLLNDCDRQREKQNEIKESNLIELSATLNKKEAHVENE